MDLREFRVEISAISSCPERLSKDGFVLEVSVHPRFRQHQPQKLLKRNITFASLTFIANNNNININYVKKKFPLFSGSGVYFFGRLR